MTFSPDSRVLLCEARSHGERERIATVIRLYSLESGRELAAIRHAAFSERRFSPDGRLLAFRDKDTGIVTVWDVPPSKSVPAILGSAAAVWLLLFVGVWVGAWWLGWRGRRRAEFEVATASVPALPAVWSDAAIAAGTSPDEKAETGRAEAGEPIRPLDWHKIVPAEPAATSDRLGWVVRKRVDNPLCHEGDVANARNAPDQTVLSPARVGLTMASKRYGRTLAGAGKPLGKSRVCSGRTFSGNFILRGGWFSGGEVRSELF
jgi:hypothetical protein